MSEMRPLLLFCLILANSRFTSVLSSTSVGAATGARSLGGGSAWLPCRCTPDQFEAVLKSVEREMDLQSGSRSDWHGDYDVVPGVPSGANDVGEESEAGHERLSLAGPMVVEAESSTSVFYDYTNGLLATVEHVGRVKTIVNHETGVQYVISPEGSCRRGIIEHRMKRMCLPDGAVLSAKFSIGFDQPVSLWKYDGPNNSSLRTVVERRRCVPILEETFSVEDGYASLTSTVYTNVRLGIRDKGIFNPPPSCLNNTDDMRDVTNSTPPDGNERN